MSTLPERLDTRLNVLGTDKSLVAWITRFVTHLNQVYIKMRSEILYSSHPRQVTYTTNMNTDIAGIVPEIVYSTADSKYYGCTTTGKVAGTAVWAALN